MAAGLSRLVKFIRYRFLLFAGLLPYALGTSISYRLENQFNLTLFLVGLTGLIFVLIGVEAFNEYFDWWLGSDRVFQLNPQPVTRRTFIIGLVAFALAGLVAIWLTLKVGTAIIIISAIGFMAAFFYLGPPIRFAYRGLGELVIAISYGPFMMLGAYYLQTGQISIQPVLVSLMPAFLLFTIAIMNEVPDYLQDRLVGKRNICVRLGPEKVTRLCGWLYILCYSLLLGGILSKNLPSLSWVGLGGAPISFISYFIARQKYAQPAQFIPAIRYALIHYVFIMSVLIIGHLH